MSRCLREWAFSSTYGKSGGAVWVGEERRGEVPLYPQPWRAACGGRRAKAEKPKNQSLGAVKTTTSLPCSLTPSLPHSRAFGPAFFSVAFALCLRYSLFPSFPAAALHPSRLFLSLSPRRIFVTPSGHPARHINASSSCLLAAPALRLCRRTPKPPLPDAPIFVELQHILLFLRTAPLVAHAHAHHAPASPASLVGYQLDHHHPPAVPRLRFAARGITERCCSCPGEGPFQIPLLLHVSSLVVPTLRHHQSHRRQLYFLPRPPCCLWTRPSSQQPECAAMDWEWFW